MNAFSHLVGNEDVKNYLATILKRQAISNSLLFAGPEGVGKSLFALAFARELLAKTPEAQAKFEAGNHPDLHIFRPEGKIGMHSIQSMRELTEMVYKHPYEAERKVFIIYDADRMLTYSANALLKTFEEPAKQSVIILLSHAPQRLLPTVLSRCRSILFQTVPESLIQGQLIAQGKPIEEAKILASRARGSFAAASRLQSEEGNQVREKLLALLAQPKFTHYQQVMQAAADIANVVEAAKSGIEEASRKEHVHEMWDHLSAVQKEEIEKEIEGAVAMRQTAEAHALFDVILSWYRDLWLLHTSGNTVHLLNNDRYAALEQAYQRGELLPLSKVQEFIAQAKLALERSTSLQIALEGLLLQLRFA